MTEANRLISTGDPRAHLSSCIEISVTRIDLDIRLLGLVLENCTDTYRPALIEHISDTLQRDMASLQDAIRRPEVLS
jgi:hypothetical protein